MTARVPIGIVLNGVTGRMRCRQHLVRSLDRPANPAGLLPDAEPAAGVGQ